MTQVIKRMGMSVMLAFAIAAIGAPGALAVPTFHSESEHTIGKGIQEGQMTAKLNAGTMHCGTFIGEGTMVNQTVTEVTAIHSFSECKVTPFGGATYHVNGCYNIITADLEAHLKCPLGKNIVMTAPFCTITIRPQSATSVEYINVGSGKTSEIIAEESAPNLHYTQTAGCAGGSGTFENGTVHAVIRTTAMDTNENHVGIWWSDS